MSCSASRLCGGEYLRHQRAGAVAGLILPKVSDHLGLDSPGSRYPSSIKLVSFDQVTRNSHHQDHRQSQGFGQTFRQRLIL
jgi:hypothetical protein